MQTFKTRENGGSHCIHASIQFSVSYLWDSSHDASQVTSLATQCATRRKDEDIVVTTIFLSTRLNARSVYGAGKKTRGLGGSQLVVATRTVPLQNYRTVT